MTTQSQTPETDRTPIGVVRINVTTYTVYRLPAGQKSRALGIRANFALEGPKGSKFLVTDHGPRYELTSVSVTGGLPRPLRGLKRSHLAAFGVEV